VHSLNSSGALLQRQIPGRNILIALSALAVLVVGLIVLGSRQENAKPRYHIRIAVPSFESSALVILAQEMGYFQLEGVAASLEYRLTGKDCLAMVTAGESDLAVAFETPITHAIMEGHPILVLTEVHRSEQNTAVVARKDRAIDGAADFRGKRIAVVPRTNAQFLLELFLHSHLIDLASVTMVEMPITKAVEAVEHGLVDAAALWQPYVSQSIAKNPESFTLFRSSFYSEFSMLAGLRENLDSQEEAILAVMRALMRSRNYFDSHTEQARDLVDKVLKEKGFFVSPVAWPKMDIHLGLSATLLTMMNEEMIWYQNKKKTDKRVRIDMKAVFRARYLKQLSPDLVTYE
jgi:NitT/TauT family transport system substrate-binding protein